MSKKRSSHTIHSADKVFHVGQKVNAGGRIGVVKMRNRDGYRLQFSGGTHLVRFSADQITPVAEDEKWGEDDLTRWILTKTGVDKKKMLESPRPEKELRERPPYRNRKHFDKELTERVEFEQERSAIQKEIRLAVENGVLVARPPEDDAERFYSPCGYFDPSVACNWAAKHFQFDAVIEELPKTRNTKRPNVIAEQRKFLIDEYKRRHMEEHGTKPTDDEIAHEANPKWNDRTPVMKWKLNDPKCTDEMDRRIRRVIEEKRRIS